MNRPSVHTGAGRPGRKGERGVALVVALVMLVLLSILGAFSISTSTTELRISGNYRNNQEAFYIADATVDYAQTFGDIYKGITPGTENTWPKAGTGDTPSNPDMNRENIGTGTGDMTVTWLFVGALPPGSGYDADAAAGFQAHYFAIDVIGTGLNNAEVSIEAQTARVVPK